MLKIQVNVCNQNPSKSFQDFIKIWDFYFLFVLLSNPKSIKKFDFEEEIVLMLWEILLHQWEPKIKESLNI